MSNALLKETVCWLVSMSRQKTSSKHGFFGNLS